MIQRINQQLKPSPLSFHKLTIGSIYMKYLANDIGKTNSCYIDHSMWNINQSLFQNVCYCRQLFCVNFYPLGNFWGRYHVTSIMSTVYLSSICLWHALSIMLQLFQTFHPSEQYCSTNVQFSVLISKESATFGQTKNLMIKSTK